MPYATLADLYARFGDSEIDQVADTSSTGSADPVLVNRAIGDAAAEIDAALVGRYQLPLLPVPALLTRIACDMARESLYSDNPPPVVESRAKTARGLLRAVAAGQLRLEGAAPALASAGDQGLVEMVSGRRHSPFLGG